MPRNPTQTIPVDKPDGAPQDNLGVEAVWKRDKTVLIGGHAVCDAAMRKHVDLTLARPADFPYPIGV